jgi:aspartate kinase
MEQPIVSAVTSEVSEVKVTITAVPDRPGVAATVFRALAERAVNVDMIVQNTSREGLTDISFTVPRAELVAAREVTQSLSAGIGAREVLVDEGIAQVSIVGAGMKTHPGVTAMMFETFAEAGINIEMISTSPIRISCVVRAEAVDKAVRALHDAFGLGG